MKYNKKLQKVKKARRTALKKNKHKKSLKCERLIGVPSWIVKQKLKTNPYANIALSGKKQRKLAKVTRKRLQTHKIKKDQMDTS